MKFSETRYSHGEEFPRITSEELANDRTIFTLVSVREFNHNKYGKTWLFTVDIEGEFFSLFMSAGQIGDRDSLAEHMLSTKEPIEEVVIKEVGRSFIFCSPEDLEKENKNKKQSKRNNLKSDIPF